MILAGRAPYLGAELLAFLAARIVPGVESYDGRTYRRSLRLAHGAGVVALTPADGRDGGRARPRRPARRGRGGRAAAARCSTSTRTSDAIAAVLTQDPVLRFTPGRRVPGAVDGYEIAVRAVLTQQISIRAASTHAARLTRATGDPIRPRGPITHLFPTVQAIAEAPDSALAMPARRRDTLRSLHLAPLDRLTDLAGVGPWTQAYVDLRARRDPDAWLPTDLGVRHALTRLGHDGDAERWRPVSRICRDPALVEPVGSRAMRKGFLLALAATLLLAPTARAAGGCPQGATCGTVTVPLDHTGGTPGILRIAYSRVPATGTRTGTLVLLAGGPGQAAIPFTDSFSELLTELRPSYDIVYVDQRGTGGSGAVQCGSRDCASALGAARPFMTTFETAADLEDLRVALGVDQLTPLGVSYGTAVADAYARLYPEHTAALILDSPVPVERLGRRAQPRRPSPSCRACSKASAPATAGAPSGRYRSSGP